MADDVRRNQPRRGCAAARNVVPSSVHYLGYVEEDETPEAIEKKFEELAKVRALPGLNSKLISVAGLECASRAAFKVTRWLLDAQVEAAAGAASKAQREAREVEGSGAEPGSGGVAELAEAGLTEEQLMEVFKQTSIFNVRSAMAGNEALLGADADAGDSDRCVLRHSCLT